MGENNEATRIMNGLVGLLLFCVVTACVAILIVAATQREEHFVQTMRNATDSSKLQRMVELEMQSDAVMCTAVANVLSEFGPEELAYVAIEYDGTWTVYYYNQVDVHLDFSYIGNASSAPIEEAVKELLKHSERNCTLSVDTDDNGFSHVLVTVI